MKQLMYKLYVLCPLCQNSCVRRGLSKQSSNLSDSRAGEREPRAGWRSSSGEVLPGDGPVVWAVRETTRHEWGSDYDDALHQLCAAKMSGLLTETRWQAGRTCQEVSFLS